MYMTVAQERDATTAKGRLAGGMGRGLASGLVSEGKGWSRGCHATLGGLGLLLYKRGMKDRMARDMMYSTICSLIWGFSDCACAGCPCHAFYAPQPHPYPPPLPVSGRGKRLVLDKVGGGIGVGGARWSLALRMPEGPSSTCPRSSSSKTYRRAIPEHGVTANTACDECIEVALLAAVKAFLDEKEDLVHCRKLCEVHSVRARSAQDTVDTCAPRLVAEQCGHDQRVGEAHFAAVDQTVTGGLDNCEKVVVRRAGVS